MKTKELFMRLYEDYSPTFDPFGTAISAMFDVAGEAYNRSLHIPADWGYSPGLGEPVIEDEYVREEIAKLTDDELMRLGRFLDRLTTLLEKAGKGY